MANRKILNPKYQISFIFHFSIIILSGFGIAGCLIIIFLNRKMGPTYLEGIYNLRQIQATLPITIFITAFIQTLALCIITFIASLFWSHSISGPLLRFRRHLKNICLKETEKEAMTFRDTDQLHGLAQAFSEMVICHNDNKTKALALLVEAQKILDEAKAIQNRNNNNTHAIDLKLNELKNIYLRIKDIYKNKKIN